MSNFRFSKASVTFTRDINTIISLTDCYNLKTEETYKKNKLTFDLYIIIALPS